MANVLVEETSLQNIANAIRKKNLKPDKYTPGEMPEAILELETGLDTGDATATAGDILSGKTAYIATGKAEGTIQIRTAEDMTVSGATVTVPSGYYAGASKSIASGSAATPDTTVTANPTITVSAAGLITANVSASQNVTPTVSAGYVSSGTAGAVTVSGSATEQLTTKGAETFTPKTTSQTIAAKTYLTGTQTIAGSPYLTAENIKSGVTIFGVTGTYAPIYDGTVEKVGGNTGEVGGEEGPT